MTRAAYFYGQYVSYMIVLCPHLFYAGGCSFTSVLSRHQFYDVTCFKCGKIVLGLCFMFFYFPVVIRTSDGFRYLLVIVFVLSGHCFMM